MLAWLLRLLNLPRVAIDTREIFPRPFIYYWRTFRRGAPTGYKCRAIPLRLSDGTVITYD